MRQITSTDLFRPIDSGVPETWGILIVGPTGDTVLSMAEKKDGTPKEAARFSTAGAHRDRLDRTAWYSVNLDAATSVWLI